MSRLLQSAGWWWKPVAALALAALLATWADAAPPAGGRGTATTEVATTDPAAADPTGVMAEIVALAEFLADELDLTFSDPLEEMYFFFAVVELYFQVQRQQARAARHMGGRSGRTTLGSRTTVNR